MNRLNRVVLSLVLGALFAGSAAQAADAEAQRLQDILAKRLPPQMRGPVTPSAVPGLYEMQLGARLVYVSADGRYILQGEIFDMEQTRNITRARQKELRVEAMDALGEENMMVYEPKETRYQVTVFTDIDCPYCRRMHNDMAGYLERGIRVRYLLYPRAGKGSGSHRKAVSVWCAQDRKGAMDAAMSGGNLSEADCAAPVDAHLALGEQFGISGTPAIVLGKGALVPGYLPPDKLLQTIELRETDPNNQ